MRAKKRRLIHILMTAAGAGFCAFFSIPCAAAVIVMSAAFLIFYESIFSHRRDQVMNLCDDIDRILRSDDTISFDEFKEGELSVLSAEIHKMTIRLREQNAALLTEKQFAKEALEDISHQLRTPLTSVMMILGLMNDSGLTEQERMEYLRDLYELLARMKWLIETMLSLSRIEADAVKFAKNTVSCRELIAQSIETVAIVNLLKNAIEHTPQGGTVTVTANGSNISSNITIADTGEGIPEKELPHIFERFYRSSEYTKNGFGIGLAFAKKVISAQDGSLKAANHKPHGAMFDIHFYKTTI